MKGKRTWPAKEQELAEPVVRWLEDQQWTVYEEVQLMAAEPIADIMAVQDGLLWIIEVKRSLGLAVLGQAAYWTSTAHYVSVATPLRARPARTRCVADELLDHFGVGSLLVSPGRVCENIPPRLHRAAHRSAKWTMPLLHDGHRTGAKAGTAGGGHYTAFRGTCEVVAQYVAAHPGCSLKELFDSIDTHYKSSATARACLAKWIRRGIVTGVCCEKVGRELRLYSAERD